RVVVVSVLLAVACTFLEPVRTTLFYGQINLVLMALVLWDVSRADGSRIKGVGVGIAAGIKLTPAYFVLYYLVLRKWRAARPPAPAPPPAPPPRRRGRPRRRARACGPAPARSTARPP
ncbi:glycosyltransferase 87 family protein, partial [Prescottella defluvii]|uniref:glycosyltransferase 87 family protein n=1 Tax=Prescottella defluvii TaxID=1323361 RepID=UPI0012E0AC7F